MTIADKNKWDARYSDKTVPDTLLPDDWLVECTRNVSPGRALDVACGRGHNAVWLARQGWQVDAVDVSETGLSLARELSSRENSEVHWIRADLDDWRPADDNYDLIDVFRFLDRSHIPRWIPHAIKPGGRLCYETFLNSQMKRSDNHLMSSRFSLEPQELPKLFPTLVCETYVEVSLADRDVARFLGVRPGS